MTDHDNEAPGQRPAIEDERWRAYVAEFEKNHAANQKATQNVTQQAGAGRPNAKQLGAKDPEGAGPKRTWPRTLALLTVGVIAIAGGLWWIGALPMSTTGHPTAKANPPSAVPRAAIATPTPITSPSITPSSTATGVGAHLMADLVPLPTGATPWTRTPTGVLDLNGFIHGFFVSSAWTGETELAVRRGYVTSVREGWFDPDGTQSDIFLVQFHSAAGAQSMYLDLTHGWKDDPSQGTTFTASGGDGMGLVDTKLDSMGNTHVVLLAVHGDTLVRVFRFSAATPDRMGAESLLERQIKALGG